MLALLQQHLGRLGRRLGTHILRVGIRTDAQHFRIRAHGKIVATRMHVDRPNRLHIFQRGDGYEGR